MVEGPESNLKVMRGINAKEEKGFCTTNAVEDGTDRKEKVI